MFEKNYEIYTMQENEAGEQVRWKLLNRCSTLEKAVEVANAYNCDDIDIFYRSGSQLCSVAWDKPQSKPKEGHVRVFIGRSSGPSTDKEVSAEFPTNSLDIIKDVLVMVNRASNNKEQWYITVGEESKVIIPQ